MNFSVQIFEKKKPLIPNFVKIRPVGDEVVHAYPNMSKLIVAFRNFANAPKNKGWTQTL